MKQSDPFPHHRLAISRSDRWHVYHRLNELNISCLCLNDGSLVVNANTPAAIVQIWSVLFQQTASRQQLIGWLEQSLSL